MNEELFYKVLLMHVVLGVVVAVLWAISEWRERRRKR